MIGMETRCAAKGCDADADAYGDGTLHTIAVGKPTKFYVKIWLCLKHAKLLKG